MAASNLPPGLTQGMIDRHFEGGPCEVCGRSADNCTCPECQVCGEAGDPHCYQSEDGHGMQRNIDQEISRTRTRIDERIMANQGDECYIHYLEGQKERGYEYP